jgi:hypothetical protein
MHRLHSLVAIAVLVLAAATILPPASASAQTNPFIPEPRMSVTAQVNGDISVQWTPRTDATTLTRYNNGSLTTIPISPTNPTYTDPKPSGIVCYQYSLVPFLCIVPNSHSAQNPVVPTTINAYVTGPGGVGGGPNFGVSWGRPAVAVDSFWILRNWGQALALPSSADGWPAYAWPGDAGSPPMCQIVAAVQGSNVVGWSDLTCILYLQ